MLDIRRAQGVDTRGWRRGAPGGRVKRGGKVQVDKNATLPPAFTKKFTHTHKILCVSPLSLSLSLSPPNPHLSLLSLSPPKINPSKNPTPT